MSPGAALLLSLLASGSPAGLPADPVDIPTDTAAALADSAGVLGAVAGESDSKVAAAPEADGRRLRPSPAPAAALRPIRTNTPGTGVFIGSGLLVRTLFDRESNGTASLETWTALTDFRYTPATHWVIGARLPVVLDRRLEGTSVGTIARSGVGDASLSVKHRLFRKVGMWSDRHAAVELEAKLPTGRTDLPEAPGLSAGNRHRLTPATGSVDFVADLVYQEGRQRFVYGGDLSFRLNTDGDGGYRFGNEARLNLDLEYILFPLEYRRPGNEVFVLLESTVRRKWADEVDGRSLPETGRTDVLLAPAVQHIISDQLLASLSVQVPVVSDAPGDGLEQDLNVLAELRYAL